MVGLGNVLRGDDGFGVAAAERLVREPVPEGVRVLELGIGGIHLVQDLMEGPVDGLVVIDAVDLGRQPGTVFVIRPDVLDVGTLPLRERHDQLADMHYATPGRASMLARALGVLPESTWVVGCQPGEVDVLREGLSLPVVEAVGEAAARVREVVTALGITWAEGEAGE